jgi:nucleotide-binding universal stress UspA family protein
MIKTILLPMMGDQSDTATLAMASLVARRLGAHVEFLYARTDPATLLTAAGNDDLGANPNALALLGELEKIEEARATRARQRALALFEEQGIAVVEAAQGSAGATAAWHENMGDPVSVLIERARYNDLLILPPLKESSGLGLDELGAVLMSSGRPVLLAPREPPASLAGTAVIAWKNTPEAARAVTTALPFLSAAEKILIVVVGEGGEGDDGSSKQIIDYLGWHGLAGTGQQVAAGDRSAPEALLAAASAAKGDLLIMGGYGHSRMREMVLGGFTRHVLRSAELPVLMLH